MTDFLADSPSIARCYCPACEPDADPSREILDVRWCEMHAPARDGVDDAGVTAGAFLSGSAEAGGEDNRRWCEVVHGASRGQAGPLRRRDRSGRPARRAS